MTDDDDYLPPQHEKPRSRGRWWYFPLFLVLFAGVVFWLFFSDRVIPTELERGTDRFRGAVLKGNLDPMLPEFDRRDDRHRIAIQMAEDGDSRVRLGAAELLVRGDRKPEPPRMWTTRQKFERHDDLPGGIMVPALNKLIKDQNAEVRRAAIRSAGSVTRTALFSTELLHTLWFGPLDERLLVANDLGHWNGAEARRVFSSSEQPVDVRLAALRSAEKWDNRQFVGGRLDEALIPVFADPEARVRLLAIEASRWVAAADVVPVWFHAARSRHPDVARRAIEVWIEELVNNDDVDGLSGVRNAKTRDLFRAIPGRPGTPPTEVVALAGSILCRAAVGHGAKLNRMADDHPEWRIRSIIDTLRHMPPDLDHLYANGGPVTLTTWLPHENALGDPPRRELAAYLLEQMKEPARWVEKERDREMILEVNLKSLRVGKPQTVGGLADFYGVPTFEAIERNMRAATGKH